MIRIVEAAKTVVLLVVGSHVLQDLIEIAAGERVFEVLVYVVSWLREQNKIVEAGQNLCRHEPRELSLLTTDGREETCSSRRVRLLQYDTGQEWKDSIRMEERRAYSDDQDVFPGRIGSQVNRRQSD